MNNRSQLEVKSERLRASLGACKEDRISYSGRGEKAVDQIKEYSSSKEWLNFKPKHVCYTDVRASVGKE